MSRRSFLKTCLASSVPLVTGSYAVFIERNLVQFNDYTIPLENLPRKFRGFTIVQLTDIHFGFLVSESFVRKLVEKVNHLQKDMVALTGDYVHARNTVCEIDTVWPILSQLQAPCGVHAVLGNHDHWSSTERSLFWMGKTGQNIRHRSKKIRRGNEKIWIGGAGDFYEDDPGIDDAFSGVPGDAFKLLLAHNPDTVDASYTTDLDLVLAGHTHGGQIRIPFVGAPVLPVKNRAYSSGIIKTPKTTLYISRGIGWAILPVRFNCFPEVSIIRLQSTEPLPR